MKKPLRWKVQKAPNGWQGVIELGTDEQGDSALAVKCGSYETPERAFAATRNMAERLAGEIEHVLPERTLGAVEELGFVSVTDGLAVAKGLTKGISSLFRKKKKKAPSAPAAAPAAAASSTARPAGTRASAATRSSAPASGPNAPATKADLEAIVRTFRERG